MMTELGLRSRSVGRSSLRGLIDGFVIDGDVFRTAAGRHILRVPQRS